MKRILAFDLDGTLAASKSPMTDTMAQLLNNLLDHFHICVISGGNFAQFDKQMLANIKAEPIKLAKLHLMPTCGTRYYKYDVAKSDWEKVDRKSTRLNSSHT